VGPNVGFVGLRDGVNVGTFDGESLGLLEG